MNVREFRAQVQLPRIAQLAAGALSAALVFPALLGMSRGVYDSALLELSLALLLVVAARLFGAARRWREMAYQAMENNQRLLILSEKIIAENAWYKERLK